MAPALLRRFGFRKVLVANAVLAAPSWSRPPPSRPMTPGPGWPGSCSRAAVARSLQCTSVNAVAMPMCRRTVFRARPRSKQRPSAAVRLHRHHARGLWAGGDAAATGSDSVTREMFAPVSGWSARFAPVGDRLPAPSAHGGCSTSAEKAPRRIGAGSGVSGGSTRDMYWARVLDLASQRASSFGSCGAGCTRPGSRGPARLDRPRPHRHQPPHRRAARVAPGIHRPGLVEDRPPHRARPERDEQDDPVGLAFGIGISRQNCAAISASARVALGALQRSISAEDRAPGLGQPFRRSCRARIAIFQAIQAVSAMKGRLSRLG